MSNRLDAAGKLIPDEADNPRLRRIRTRQLAYRTPLVMGGQGRSAGSITDTAKITGYVLLIVLLYLTVMWAIRNWLL